MRLAKPGVNANHFHSMNFFSRSFSLFNVLTGESFEITQTPFKIGSGEDCDLRLDAETVDAEHCVFQKKGGKTFLIPCDGIGYLLLDGVAFHGGELESRQDHTLCIGGNFFALNGSA